MAAITPCLGFETEAEEAARFYVSVFGRVFGRSEVLSVSPFSERELAALASAHGITPDTMPGVPGSVKGVRFTLSGQELFAFNGGAYFGKFTESVSLYVTCDTQDEIDSLWAALADGGVEQPGGWVKDRYGVSWQIGPSLLWEIDSGDDAAKSERLYIALLQMTKTDIETLRRAVEG